MTARSVLLRSLCTARENVDEDILLLGRKGRASAVEVDLMQPLDPARGPRVHLPPLNHIGLWVDDLPAAVAWMARSGVRFAPGGVSVVARRHSFGEGVVAAHQPRAFHRSGKARPGTM